jgi:hypothetical protein
MDWMITGSIPGLFFVIFIFDNGTQKRIGSIVENLSIKDKVTSKQ